MLRLLGLVITVGIADSVNPSTVGPGLYLATAKDAAWRVMQFTAGVFAVNFGAGLAVTIGPGLLLLGLVPHPRGTPRDVIELVAGSALLGTAVALWLGRRRLARQQLPGRSGRGRSAVVAGASIAAVEMPTAAPYLAVIAAIAASTVRLPGVVLLLAVYNVAFVLPLLGIVVLLLVAGDRAKPRLEAAASWLQRRWPVVLAGLLTFAGGVIAVLGGTGLVRQY